MTPTERRREWASDRNDHEGIMAVNAKHMERDGTGLAAVLIDHLQEENEGLLDDEDLAVVEELAAQGPWLVAGVIRLLLLAEGNIEAATPRAATFATMVRAAVRFLDAEDDDL